VSARRVTAACKPYSAVALLHFFSVFRSRAFPRILFAAAKDAAAIEADENPGSKLNGKLNAGEYTRIIPTPYTIFL
jgi:hypothetical protein